MLTLLLILIPIICSGLLFILGKNMARPIAIIGSLIELILAFVALNAHMNGQTDLLTIDQAWIASPGIRFHIAADGISMLMILLATLLMPLIIYNSFNKEYNNAHYLYGLMFMMQGSIVGSFVAMDGFLFYLFWEVALIPIYFILLIWGGDNRQKITFKFFIYTLFGSLFMLLALIYVYLQTPDRSFDIQALYQAGRQLDVVQQAWIMAAIFLAFAIKMPIVPFHTWQPNTYYTAPTPGVMMLSGIMSKMATYGMIRWILPMVPDGVQEYGYILIIISVISILYASFISMVQKDFKYLIAYASIAHMGLIAAGIIASNTQSLQGSLIEMLSHGINTIGLFIVYDIIFIRTGTTKMTKLGGIRGIDSSFAFMFFIIVLSVVALPFTNGFVGEFLLILGLFQNYPVAASFAGLSIILGVVYMFRSFQAMMLGETNSITSNLPKLNIQEKTILIAVVLMIITFGVYPKIILSITEGSIQNLLQGIQ
ncbi:MAG: NADH-quinone oxidoreductase subunit M [Bacteroidia bacterium]|nr:NADH-quinone oxidoreductase subunit M [Bacteroidia bacterium]